MTPAERKRQERSRRKAEREQWEADQAEREATVVRPMPAPADPVGALAAWSQNTLRVPPGHPLAGQPLTLPEYGRRFLVDALQARESLLLMGRKNAKSAARARVVGRVPALCFPQNRLVRRVARTFALHRSHTTTRGLTW